MNKTIFILCILCFFSSCDFSDDTDEDLESSLKKIQIINNTDKTVAVYRVREKDGVPEQRMDTVAAGSYIYINIQYRIHVDGQFSAVYNGSVHGYDADVSSGDQQTITIEAGDFP